MTKTYVIEQFEQIISIGTTFRCNWFRGHSGVYNSLTPSIFRKTGVEFLRHHLQPNLEMSYAEEFKRCAPSYANNSPNNNKNLEWLFLMQHHGTPTRLLDWTENILVATFFAVVGNPDKDGELWSMLPWRLNELGGIGWGLPLPQRSKAVNFLANEIFHNNPDELKNEMGLDNIPQSPLALKPPLSHSRYLAQQSCFTIHPKPIAGKAIIDLLEEERYLTRYIIHQSLKRKFEVNLRSLGISHSTLFPDLEGLSKTVIRNEELLIWSQPEHPEFQIYTEEKGE